MVDIRDLHVNYGAVSALRGVSLSVRSGEIVALVGANGAGKSTLLNAICGVCAPSDGQVRYLGQPIEGMPPHLVARLGIAQSPEGRRVFARMTVEENLVVGARNVSSAVLGERMKEQFALFPRLEDRRHQRAGTLSGGEQQMLAIARALMSDPKLLLLDEPSLGLAPLIIRSIFAAVKEINSNRRTAVLLVEQNAFQALKLAHRGYVLVNGKIEIEGLAADLLVNPAVRSAYLEGSVTPQASEVQF
jgi:branched-chain amino acid transport system ATP-binding protein